MQTQYKITPSKAVKGMPLAARRKSRPRQLAWRAQAGTLVLTNSSEAGDLLLVLRDVKTRAEYELTVAISGATEATSLNEIVAAIQANGDWGSRLIVSDDNTLTVSYTARQANRVYEIDVDPPGSMSVTHNVVTTAGGAGIEMGTLVARGSAEGTFDAPGATTTVDQIAGLLFRTDANHFHSLENDTPSAIDLCERGKHYAIAEQIEAWMEVEEAVTESSTPYMRRAATSSVGTPGDLRASPAGTAQVATLTVVADLQNYAVAFGINGRDYSFSYNPTDGTTATDDVVDGLEDAAAAEITQRGIGSLVAASAASAAAAFTLTTAAGVVFDYVTISSFGEDTEVVAGTVSLGTADADAIDVSSILRFTGASALVDGVLLAPVMLNLQP
jgi:hypothetical protein